MARKFIERTTQLAFSDGRAKFTYALSRFWHRKVQYSEGADERKPSGSTRFCGNRYVVEASGTSASTTSKRELGCHAPTSPTEACA